MLNKTHVGVLVTVVTILLLVCACSGDFEGSSAVEAGLAPASDAAEGTAYPDRSIALAAALAEVDAYEPAGDEIDQLVLDELKSELKQVFIDLYGGDPLARDLRRRTMALGPSEWNRAWCLQASTSMSSAVKLKWRGRHIGDYNLDGLVTVADLTPLGFHFNVAPDFDADGLPVNDGDNEWAAEVDGNVDGLIAVSDLTPIGANYQSRHLGYRVYLGSGPDAGSITWAADYLPNPDDAEQPFTVPFNTSRDAGHVAKYEFEFSPAAPAEGQLNYVRLVAWDGSAEGEPREIPVLDGPHASFSCELCHVMPTMAFREPAGSCHLCHATPPEDAQATWSDPPPLHQPCMNCHVAHGFSIDPPQTPCSVCHSSIASAVSGAGMPNCLGCHATPHIPNPQPTATDCQTCHTAPPDLPAETWDNAPGMHGSCLSCHSEHGFAIGEPNAICADCHGALIDSGHSGGNPDCLGCHTSPHIPATAATGMDCFSCHPNPPENPSAAWADAPGNHAQCFLCHIGEEHGSKPVPPESICGNCHSELISEGHGGGHAACLDCHDYPHLPEMTLSVADCLLCHPAPPEDLSAQWADAPGDHAQCLECHPGPEHGNKPVPAESICANCHSQLISEGHAGGDTLCMGCHQFPHLPALSFPNCLDCHPTPPEDVTASWDDVPGQHNQCALCHPGPEHGNKPVPPESICANCHSELIDEGHAGGVTDCLACHLYPHVTVKPEELHDSHTPENGVQCSDCHNMHGGMDPDRDDCLACHTDKVDHYPGVLCSDCH